MRFANNRLWCNVNGIPTVWLMSRFCTLAGKCGCSATTRAGTVPGRNNNCEIIVRCGIGGGQRCGDRPQASPLCPGKSVTGGYFVQYSA
jgi:hypothetical protein